MDLGVGSFVFSQGVVSAMQIIKDPAYLTSPVVSKFIRVTRKSLPMIFPWLYPCYSRKSNRLSCNLFPFFLKKIIV